MNNMNNMNNNNMKLVGNISLFKRITKNYILYIFNDLTIISLQLFPESSCTYI